MASIREQIVDAAVAALGGAGKPAGLTVHRSRHRPIEKDGLPAMVAYLGSEVVTDHAAVRVLRTLTLRVECRATGDPPDTALDPLVTWAAKALKADEQLGGLAIRISETRSAWEAVQNTSGIYAAALVEFEVEYHTSHTDPESQG